MPIPYTVCWQCQPQLLLRSNGQGHTPACAALHPQPYLPTKVLVSSKVEDKQIHREKLDCDNIGDKPGKGLGNQNTQLLARSISRKPLLSPVLPVLTSSVMLRRQDQTPVSKCKKHP